MEKDMYFYFAAKTRLFGKGSFLRMTDVFGDCKGFYEASEGLLEKSRLFTEAQISYLKTLKNATNPGKEYDSMLRGGITMLPFFEEDYPEYLKEIKSPPIALFYKGKMPCREMPAVALIGARECSAYGANLARRMGELFAENKISLISGMARGVDSMSQNACMDAGGYSLAFLGGGVDIIYPRESRSLYYKLCERGCVVSEFVPGTEPLKHFFAMRNRLISGISDGVCVIEAKEKSGTMITVDCALEQGKDVYAIPGRITDITSTGTNELIKQGASMVTDVHGFVEEILSTYGRGEIQAKQGTGENISRLRAFNEKEIAIIKEVSDNSFTIDQMSSTVGIPAGEILGLCISLSGKGMLNTVGAGRFIATNCCISLKNSIIANIAQEDE